MPVMRVGSTLDTLPRAFRPRNKIEKDAYVGYNADEMYGPPDIMQIVGRRLCDSRKRMFLGYEDYRGPPQEQRNRIYADDQPQREFQMDPEYIVVIIQYDSTRTCHLKAMAFRGTEVDHNKI